MNYKIHLYCKGLDERFILHLQCLCCHEVLHNTNRSNNKVIKCSMYSVTCLNWIPMGPSILFGVDRIWITQARLFVKKFLYCSCFDNKMCLLLDGLADILHFTSVVIFKSTVKMFFLRRIFNKEVLFNNNSLKHETLLMFLHKIDKSWCLYCS